MTIARYAFGDNSFGNLGDNTNVAKKTPVRVLLNKTVVQVAASTFWAHALVCLCAIVANMKIQTNEGHVYSWGWLYGAQLFGSKIPIRAYTFPNDSVFITTISSFDNHVLCLSSKGEVYVFGGNNFGQLGMQAIYLICIADGTMVESSTGLAMLVKFPGTSVATQIAAGYGASLVLMNNNDMFAWGHTLLSADGGSEPSLRPIKVNKQYMPSRVISNIASGFLAFYAQTSESLYSWGNGYLRQVTLIELLNLFQ